MQLDTIRRFPILFRGMFDVEKPNTTERNSSWMSKSLCILAWGSESRN